MKKLNDKKLIIIFAVVGIVLFIVLGIKIYLDFFKDNSIKKEIDSIGFYGYTLNNNDTELYKDTFKTLGETLNEKTVDYIEYAKLISQLFIIDLYTLENKLTSTDIGGTDFLHKDLIDNFKENMGAGLYKTVESNLDGKRTQKLPKVSEVTVDDVFETKYSYKDKEYDAYLISVSWKYEKDLGYQTESKLTIIKSSNVLYIVKGE